MNRNARLFWAMPGGEADTLAFDGEGGPGRSKNQFAEFLYLCRDNYRRVRYALVVEW
jgi:hypothetical protein